MTVPTEEQVFSGWANRHRAHAAREAINAYWQAQLQPGEAASSDTGRDPAEVNDRLCRMTCALRHLADRITGLSFTLALATAKSDHVRQEGLESPAAIAHRAATAAQALDVYDLKVAMPPLYVPGRRTGTLADLRHRADMQGLSFEAVMTRLTAELLCDLHHYSDRHATDFESVLAASYRAYAGQRLSAEGPFGTGQDSSLHPALLIPSAAAPEFELIAIHQGIVASFAEAEWHLIRTAARIDYQARQAPEYPYERDEDDLAALSRALGEMCGTSAEQIIIQLTPQIEARIAAIERGPDKAAELGHEHGRAGGQPYCGLDIDGDATELMLAFGETEWMTDANHPYRLHLVTAYADAYKAAAQDPSSAVSPVHLASRDFPERPAPDSPHSSGASAGSGQPAEARAKPAADRHHSGRRT
jgi:hypothetical protein